MRCQFLIPAVLPLFFAVLGCAQGPPRFDPPPGGWPADAIVRPNDVQTPPFKFSAADEKLLDEVERGCFDYFWREVGTPACLAKDRLKAPVASIASVGFQLSALPIGVERGWISRAEGAQRAKTVLKALVDSPDNKRWGMYLHFPDPNTAGRSHTEFVCELSTVDTALLLAGVITAGEFFGGDVKALADQMVSAADWRHFAVAKDGFLSMGWKPRKPAELNGDGSFIEWSWHLASDEERLVYLLAAGAPNVDFAVPAELYYKLERNIRKHDDMSAYVVSWPGTLFTYFFSHCWIDYARLGPDDPAQFGVTAPRVDWWENSRRAVLTHRQRCIELAKQYKTLSPNRWGLSACVGRDGYIVPDVQPNLRNEDEVFEGTVAPYAAGSAIMFTPRESVAALREMRELKDDSGAPLIWRDPAQGGYGLADAFNLDQHYVCDDYVGIDEGPLLLALENARTGLIHRLFMNSPHVKRGLERLKLGR